MPATKNEKATVVAVRPTPSWRAMAAYKGACRLTPVVMTNNANARRAARCRLVMTASTAGGAGLRRQRHLPGISAICRRAHPRPDGGGGDGGESDFLGVYLPSAAGRTVDATVAGLRDGACFFLFHG